MRETLQDRCRLFVENRDKIKKAFAWDSPYLYPMCASIYTAKNREADTERMKECKTLLRQKTRLFSNFRGTAQMANVTMLALAEDPARKLEQMLEVYEALKGEFTGSVYLTVAAAAIADWEGPSQYGTIAARTRTIYNVMKKNHPLLTSKEDSAFAALLALSALEDAQIERETESCYALLKPHFFSGNAVQSLSHVLALGEGSPEAKCRKVMELYDYIKEKGQSYGTGYELATLGVLALLDSSAARLGEEILEVNTFLKSQKGFGVFGIGAKQRLMYAAMLTMYENMAEALPAGEDGSGALAMRTTALNGVLSLVIAQQAAICAAAATASTTAAASSASN